jgi:hypothetical protein
MVWLLKTSVIGKNCLSWWGGQFNTSIGSLTCWAKDTIIQSPRKPNGRNRQTILNQTLTPCPTSLTFSKPGTTSMQISDGKFQVDYTGYVGKQSMLCFPQTGQDLVCWGQSVHPSFCSPLPEENS